MAALYRCPTNKRVLLNRLPSLKIGYLLLNVAVQPKILIYFKWGKISFSIIPSLTSLGARGMGKQFFVFYLSSKKDYRIRTNRKRCELCNDMDVAKRFRWFGHVLRMDEHTPPSRVFDAVVGEHRWQRRPRTRWKHQVEVALTSNGATNWRRQAETR